MPRAATLTLLTATSALAAAVQVSAATVEDRYGPSHPAPADAAPIATPVAAPAAAPTAAPFTLRLSSPMKTPAPVAGAVANRAPFGAVSEAPPKRLASAEPPTSLYGPHPASASRAAPVSAPASARSGPVSQVAAMTPATETGPTSNGPRFYSVHRQYGLRPDPIPLPKQFFADNAPDLAAPPPPLAPRPVPGTQAASSPANTASNRARQVEIETADSAAN